MDHSVEEAVSLLTRIYRLIQISIARFATTRAGLSNSNGFYNIGGGAILFLKK